MVSNNEVEIIPEEVKNEPIAVTALVRAKHWLASAQDYVIDTPEMAEAANEDLGQIVKLRDELETLRVKKKQPFWDKGVAIDKFFKAPKDFLVSAESVLKGSLNAYLQAEEKKRKDAEAEQQRLHQIAQEQVQEEQRKAAESLLQQAENERLALLEGASSGEEIEQIEQQHLETVQQVAEIEAAAPAFIPAPIVHLPAPTKLVGLSQRSTWVATVDSKLELIKAIANGRDDLLGLILVDESAANKLASALKKEMKIPGLTATEVFNVARARR